MRRQREMVRRQLATVRRWLRFGRRWLPIVRRGLQLDRRWLPIVRRREGRISDGRDNAGVHQDGLVPISWLGDCFVKAREVVNRGSRRRRITFLSNRSGALDMG